MIAINSTCELVRFVRVRAGAPLVPHVLSAPLIAIKRSRGLRAILRA
ncbi:MAG: hypothetical protein JNK82_39815 [Myxococcaceae bacterium]|nr:hypothetical protein [Myxococcaceae bacterium]